jgi:hypothetical protein
MKPGPQSRGDKVAVPQTPQQVSRLFEAFSTLKAERDNFLKNKFSQTFVETSVYDDAQQDGKTLLIGGKGSGKTALLFAQEIQNKDRYLTTVEINIDQLPFTALFTFFFADFSKVLAKASQNRSDIKELLELEKVTAFAWKNALLASVLLRSAETIVNTSSITVEERKSAHEVLDSLNALLGKATSVRPMKRGSGSTFTFLAVFFSVLQEVVERVLEENFPNVSILLARLIQEILDRVGDPLEEQLIDFATKINPILSRLGKRVYLRLDKFDDYYDKFYGEIVSHNTTISPDEARHRKSFLRKLLEGLVLAARDIRDYEAFALTNILIAIPQDKFLELELREGMDLILSRVVQIDWTPTELFDMVNRRIHAALSFTGPIEDSWYQVFPRVVKNAATGQPEDSFLYVARHSRWKPREIQMHVVELLERMRRVDGRELGDRDFHECIKSSCSKIVEQEFKSEFSKEYPSIHRVIHQLENSAIETVMDYGPVCNVIRGVDLADDITEPDEIMKRLYKMGMLGTRVVKSAADKLPPTVVQEHQHIAYKFHYNSPDKAPFAPKSVVAFHPMFFGSINALHTKPYVVHEMTWGMFYEA